MVQAQCKQCKKEFLTHNAWIRRGRGVMCSKACLAKWQSENVRGEKHHQYIAATHRKVCENCGGTFDPKRMKNRRFCSRKCTWLTIKGPKHWLYKSEVGYQQAHAWIRKYHGKADLCENYYCPRTSSVFEWALLKGKKHERIRENYWKLCKRCHFIYDRKEYPISLTKI